MMQRVLGNILCDLDPKVTQNVAPRSRSNIELLVNASPPKAF